MEVLSDSARGFPNDEALYTALSAHDPRFDGRFFVGVSSTGIYCRAVCTAKVPKRENCTFFPTAAAAEAAGYRPCLKCRPELAPGIPASYEMANIARSAAEEIKEGAASKSIADIAESLGVSERQLRRVFEDEYGVSPAAYRNTCRLLLAKSLLTDTDMPITRVAYSCGFSSVRRFNDAFSKQYRMSPGRLRNRTPLVKTEGDPVVLRIGYRPPFRFDLLLDFLSFRAIEGVEAVKDGAYYRTVKIDSSRFPSNGREAVAESGTRRSSDGSRFDEKTLSGTNQGAPAAAVAPTVGWIKVEDFPKKNCLKVTVSPELFGELPLVMGKVRRLFDTDCVPQAVEEGLADFYMRVPEASHIAGIRVPCSFDGFEMAVRAILGQQITVKAANTLAGRVALAFGSPVEMPIPGLTTAFPSPLAFCNSDAAEKLGELGVVRQRSKAICALANALCAGQIDLRPGADIKEAARKLLAVPGIGAWTMQYMLMRAFDYPDAFPAADYGVKCAFPEMKEKDLIELSKPWSPWRSYAVMSLWCAPHDY